MERRLSMPGFLRSEDWLGVWVGLLLIAVMLLGAWKVVTPPALKWATDSETQSLMAPKIAEVEKLIAQSGDRLKSPELQNALASLKNAMLANNRNDVVAAVKTIDQLARENTALQQTVKADVKAKETLDSIAKTTKEISAQAGLTVSKVFATRNIRWLLIFGLVLLLLSAIAMALMGESAFRFVLGFPVVFLLAAVSIFLAGNYTMSYYGIEYVIWALALGLILSNCFRLPGWLNAAVKTEFYIKTGLVIYGSQLLISDIIKLGSIGIIQTLLVITVVWYFCFWLARRLGVDDDFAAILSSAVSICGVSAAIAASGAIKGDPKKLSYTVSLVVICAIPMMILQPLIARLVGLPELVSGAWIGGTLDSTPTVIAASAMVSPLALKVSTVIKLTQNVLIGVVAFILAAVWSYKKSSGVDKPGAVAIWQRFPKFVLGFLAASLLFSFFLPKELVASAKGMIDSFRLWWFAMAFVCIGLGTRFKDVAKLGNGRPALAFVLAQVFNIFWTLILAYLFFGGLLFPAPKL